MYALLVRSGNKYGPEYSRKLKKQIQETSGLDVRVIGEDIHLKHTWPGWWAKMEVFRPDIPKPFIYVDLDSFVLKDISDITTDFRRIPREWNRSWGYQSSFMCINECKDIWERWIENPTYWMASLPGGDQDFLYMFDFDDVPEDVIGSYKLHSKTGPRHRIVTFHGNPKPHEAEGWAKELWERL